MAGKDADDPRGYDDIIDLPRPVSVTRPHMPRRDRAAQFSPFAALSGYGAVIGETARRTSERAELDEDAKSVLDGKLRLLNSRCKEQPEVAITYFRPDAQKSGGEYVTIAGAVRRVDAYHGAVVLADGTRVRITDIYAIEGDLFSGLEIE